MKPFRPILLGTLLLGGCWFTRAELEEVDSYESFAWEFANTYCHKLDECDLLDLLSWTFDECSENMIAALGSDCEDYDAGAAASCLDDWEDTSCDDFLKMTTDCGDVCSDDDSG